MKATNPTHINKTTPSMAMMPMFMPWASEESDLPKQTAQAEVRKGRRVSATIGTVRNRVINPGTLTNSLRF